jgi:hypothetical protein
MPLHLVEPNLDDRLRPQGGLLELAAAPAVRLREAPVGRVLEQRQHALGDLGVAGGGDRGRADVVELAVVPVKAEEERRDPARPLLPAQSDDDAVGRALRLHLHDRLARAGEVRTVLALGDDAVEARRLERLEPVLRHVAVACHGREAEAGGEALERRPPVRERLAPQLLSGPHEHVEGDELGGDLSGQLAHPALGRVQAHLHRVEVQDAVPRDHDLAVDRGARGQHALERPQLREVAEQRPAVAGPETQLAAGVLEQAPEPVPLRLVLPAVRRRELPHELRLHGREGHGRVELVRADGWLAAS